MKAVAMFRTWEEVAQYEGTWKTHVRVLDGTETAAELLRWKESIANANPTWPRLTSDLVVQEETER